MGSRPEDHGSRIALYIESETDADADADAEERDGRLEARIKERIIQFPDQLSLPRPRLGVGAPCAQHNVRVIWDATRWRSILRGLPAFPKRAQKKGGQSRPSWGERGFDLFGDGAVVVLSVAVAFWKGDHIDVWEHIVADAD